MKITLSQVVLPESAAKGTTYVASRTHFPLNRIVALYRYQPPVAKKPSRSAKSRNRRRAKKDVPIEAEADEGGNDDAMDVVPA